MLTETERKAMLELLHKQVVPAVGCTEPACVALCVAKATEMLGALPEKIEVALSANILKNAMGVGIPGTNMIGLPIAIALGAIAGKSDYQLEVLKDIDAAAVQRGRDYIAEKRIYISLEENAPDKLYVRVNCQAEGRHTEAVISGEHTRFVRLVRDGEVLLDKPACRAEAAD